LIDVKEAFERVWRTGLMFRLYEIGVRGKLWRIIDDMLSDTYASVRTNYGPTTRFRTTMGIVQGAVLSMLLFTIYFTPFSTACKNISPTINGMKFNPQCYVDDGTAIAVSVKQADELWSKIQSWCNRWNTILSVKRSASEILKANIAFQELGTLPLPETECGKIVGLTFYEGGMQPHPATKAILKKVGAITQALVRTEGGTTLKFETLAYLYTTYAHSIMAHTRPFLELHSSALSAYAKAQDTLLLSIFPECSDTPPFLLASEVGIYDTDLITAKENIQLNHRIMANTNDSITRKMLEWQVTTNHRSTIDKTNDYTSLLGIQIPFHTLLTYNYERLKYTLDKALTTQQQVRYTQRLSVLPPKYHSLHLSKPSWGLDHVLKTLSPDNAALYIKFRTMSFQPATQNPVTTTCRHCPHPFTSIDHVLWQCPRHQEIRAWLINTVQQEQPSFIEQLLAKEHWQKTATILGGGIIGYTSITWASIMKHVIVMLQDVTKRN
jgi:hypothetical protein